MAETRSTIFLYTDAAQIDARTKKAMVAAGFLPVKVATLDAVKMIEAPLTIPDAEISEVMRAAMQALRDCNSAMAREFFASLLTDRLVKASDKASAARDTPRQELGDAG